MTISEAISGLERLPQKIADEGEAIMRQEVPKKTQALESSIHSKISGTTIRIIAGNRKVNYARFVNDGRGEVKPVKKRALHWDDVFSMRAKPTKPNDFAQRTADRINATKFTI